jgi:threonyl-tRNA synthetase
MSETDAQADVTVVLPDGSTLTVPAGSTVEDVAYEIGPGLGRDTVAGKVDGELVERHATVHDGARVEIVTDQSDEYLTVLRHSAAHVFAQALQRLFPDATLTIGPPTDEGFYYDVTDVDLDEDDLDAIEAEMASIIEADYDIERVERSHADAEEIYADNEYKRQILAEEADDDTVTFYVQDGWQDLCRGPHVESTGEIGAAALLEVSAAYWRGDEENDTLTRVYGTAFASEGDLEEHLEMRERAKERDHRKIGQEMNLFSIPTVTGPGLPLYHPPGKTVLRELSTFANELNREHGYEEVETPHVFRTELWKQSGHYENYKDDMFLLEVNDEEYGLKPMNCPGHATIFDQQSWSYRDLPERYFENGKVYRKEQRGELSGLSRVWSFTIDDGHLFVRPDQIRAEIESVIGMIFEVVETLDLEVEVALATRPEKSVGGDEIWESAESQLRDVLESGGYEYDVEPRLRLRRRARSRLGRSDGAARFQHAGAIRAHLHRRGQRRAPAGDDPPRAVRQLRAILHGAHRALRRRLSALARSRAGQNSPRLRRDAGVRSPREKRIGRRGLPCRGRRPRLDGRSEDPRRTRRPAPVHARRRRRRGGRRDGLRAGPIREPAR